METNNTTFTPGPWHIEEEEEGAPYKIQFSPLYQACVGIEPGGVVADIRLSDYHDSFTPETARANARLIAAAPDLYAALKELEAHHVEQNRRKGRDESHSTTLRIIRAALAKVQGGAE